jgi:hypothetical protein
MSRYGFATTCNKGGDVIGLTHTIDYIIMLLVAAGLGAIGGLGAELLLKRGDNTGTIQLPSRLRGTDLVELGFPASVIIGAIAALAILYFFPPVSQTVTPGINGGAAKTTNQYDLVKLVALSLIVGSAGPAFLSTAQSRLMSALNAQKAGTAVDTGKNQVRQVAASATAAVPGAVQAAVAEAIPGATSEQLNAIADNAAQSLKSALQPQVQVALEQVDAITQKPQTDEAPSKSGLEPQAQVVPEQLGEIPTTGRTPK